MHSILAVSARTLQMWATVSTLDLVVSAAAESGLFNGRTLQLECAGVMPVSAPLPESLRCRSFQDEAFNHGEVCARPPKLWTSSLHFNVAVGTEVFSE
jgi:hypothetical protein